MRFLSKLFAFFNNTKLFGFILVAWLDLFIGIFFFPFILVFLYSTFCRLNYFNLILLDLRFLFKRIGQSSSFWPDLTKN